MPCSAAGGLIPSLSPPTFVACTSRRSAILRALTRSARSIEPQRHSTTPQTGTTAPQAVRSRHPLLCCGQHQATRPLVRRRWRTPWHLADMGSRRRGRPACRRALLPRAESRGHARRAGRVPRALTAPSPAYATSARRAEWNVVETGATGSWPPTRRGGAGVAATKLKLDARGLGVSAALQRWLALHRLDGRSRSQARAPQCWHRQPVHSEPSADPARLGDPNA
jgi:hypothetical protein